LEENGHFALGIGAFEGGGQVCQFWLKFQVEGDVHHHFRSHTVKMMTTLSIQKYQYCYQQNVRS